MKTKSKHTPGPWETFQHNGNWNIQSGNGYIGSLSRLPEAQANARLIAATPELLSASENSAEFIGQTLEFLYEQFPDHEMEEDSPEDLLEAFDNAGYGNPTGELYRIVAQLKRTKLANEQAIAKATGGE